MESRGQDNDCKRPENGMCQQNAYLDGQMKPAPNQTLLQKNEIRETTLCRWMWTGNGTKDQIFLYQSQS